MSESANETHVGRDVSRLRGASGDGGATYNPVGMPEPAGPMWDFLDHYRWARALAAIDSGYQGEEPVI